MVFRRRLMPSLAELVAFEAVARLGSFTKAAEELALTQGALSKQIRQLESGLQVRLFERTKRQVRITPAGQSYVNEVAPILRRLERSTNAVIAANVKRDVLNCAVLPAFAIRWLAPRLPDFAAAHPKVTVNCTTYLEPFSFDEEPMDVAIHVGTPNWPGTTAHHLFDEALVLVASPAYRDVHGLDTPESLSRATLIHNSTRPALWPIWLDKLGVKAEAAGQTFSFDQFPAIAEAAVAGLGVALLPEFFIADRLASGELVPLFDKRPRSMEAYFLVIPTAKTRDPLIVQFSRWLLNEMKHGDLTSGGSIVPEDVLA